MKYYLGIIVVFIIILIIYSRYIEDKNLNGFWKADAEFCQNAELEFFMLYMGKNESYITNNRNGYMLAKNDKGIIINSSIKMNLSPHNKLSVLNPFIMNEKKYNVVIEWEDENHDEDIFPSELHLMYYPNHGKLVMYNNDTVLGCFYKDNYLSSLEYDNLLPVNDINQLDTVDINNTDEIED
jgi:hypothetical protein